ncbi:MULTISPECIES: protein phosphatase 2C domain-containing protein [unclassified Thioalkalivibrio]|uniref:protein phosphatase 2C domain-containing protein n=1 Tax=unclassified Thioalkalivibrio TaxID=2621013 RepID=UPI00037112A5|nr:MULTISPECIES: protein phosphatase 2C domain-containing protein [unclassified Thioalkalivibrio]
MPIWDAWASSHIGGRDENQDATIILSTDEGTELLAVIADGLGGHGGGADAAACVIQAAREVWDERRSDVTLKALLQRLVATAQDKVRSLNVERGTDAGSTLAALWLRDDHAASIHVGDSRVCQFCADGFVERTLDHSIAQLQVLQGRISEDELASHPDQHRLTTSIGSDEEPQAEYRDWSLAAGDLFVLATDGFWEIADGEQQHRVLDSAAPGSALDALIQDCLEATDEGHDNTSAIVVRPLAGDTPSASVRRRWWSLALAGIFLAAALLLGAYLLLGSPQIEPAPEVAERALPRATPPAGTDSEPAGHSGPMEALADEAAEELALEQAPPEGDARAADPEGPAREDEVHRGAPRGPDPGGLDAFEQRVQIPYLADEEMDGETLSAALREADVLGDDESLRMRRGQQILEGRESIRFDLYFQGLPVWGSVVNARVEQGQIVILRGERPHAIDLPEEATLSYREALAHAEASLGKALSPADEGRLYVYRYDPEGNRYTRAWHGLVANDTYVLIDAHRGTLLQSWSAIMERSM